MPATITIKELHTKTGQHVRLAGKAQKPTPITDRGRLIAVLAPVSALSATKRRRRVVLPEYAALLKKAGHAASAPGDGVLDDLDAVRGER
ncbi:hypothetical protein [Geminisphaera colitermitum]|uniref:hypothetical protein n=1 Tax=Geminisphaera colitermitum TaxID=1148786 RepID=UPI000158D4A0|nr:hypothetical protein [Geminisphaera colitermitum]